MKQVLVTIPFAALGDPASQAKQFAVQLIGKNTDYNGAVWFDDIQIAKQAEPDVSVDSTVAAKPTQRAGALHFFCRPAPAAAHY